jgi:putative ABC transport system substrate-binding protein
MQRRQFVTLLGGAVAWPMAACAQQPAVPVVGWLESGSRENTADYFSAFRQGLAEAGYVEGQNVTIEYRFADSQYDRLPALAGELVRRRVAVIYAMNAANAVQAAKAATAEIPIVFANGSDPVKLGLVASLNRPGGNITGVSYYVGTLVAKRLELLRELVPQAATIGFLTNPANLISERDTIDLQVAAGTVGQQIVVLNATTVDELDTAFASAAQRRVGALLVDVDNLFNRRRDQIVALAARYGVAANYATRAFAEAGGLMSYGDDRLESVRQSGIYVGRVLKGEKPANLPVLLPSKFEFVINLKTAKVLGLTFPPSFHLRADKVIE